MGHVLLIIVAAWFGILPLAGVVVLGVRLSEWLRDRP